MSASSTALHLHPCLPNRLAFLDLETTGMSAERDRITEIGVLLVEDGELVQEWSSLIQPGVRVPPAIRALTGISDSMLQDARAWPHCRDPGRASAWLYPVAHNARFDYGFLRRSSSVSVSASVHRCCLRCDCHARCIPIVAVMDWIV